MNAGNKVFSHIPSGLLMWRRSTSQSRSFSAQLFNITKLCNDKLQRVLLDSLTMNTGLHHISVYAAHSPLSTEYFTHTESVVHVSSTLKRRTSKNGVLLQNVKVVDPAK
jgi:uncharacterized protein YkwD